MRTHIRQFLRDEAGSVVVGEWVFVATILMLGAVAGAAALHSPPPDESDDAPAAAAPAPGAPTSIMVDRR
jgi:hypothetical protein